MIAVLDTSIAIKWFAPDGDAGDAVAERVLREVIAHPRRFDRKLGGYDACFAALAMDLGGVWLTFDRAVHQRLAALGIARVPA